MKYPRSVCICRYCKILCFLCTTDRLYSRFYSTYLRNLIFSIFRQTPKLTLYIRTNVQMDRGHVFLITGCCQQLLYFSTVLVYYEQLSSCLASTSKQLLEYSQYIASQQLALISYSSSYQTRDNWPSWRSMNQITKSCYVKLPKASYLNYLVCIKISSSLEQQVRKHGYTYYSTRTFNHQ